MAKPIDFLEALLSPNKEWDFALIIPQGKNPIFCTPDVDIEMVRDNTYLRLTSEAGHPVPQTEAEAKKTYKIISYVQITAIQAIDYYYEQRIVPGPGIMKTV